MKKGLLLILGMLMMVSTAEATDGVKTSSKKDYFNRYGDRSIQFMERGIKFYVFPNGDLDFNTNSRARYTTQYVYRNGRRYKTKVPFNRVRISRDYYGRIKRIGNTYINYNRFGKVSRVGSVFIDYRRRKMTRVGGLQIRYDRFGNVRYFGQVKPRYRYGRNNFRFSDFIYDYNDNFFYDDDFYNDYEDYGEDDDYYYYKSKKGKKNYKKGHKEGHKEGEIIKRKKLKQEPSKERKRRS